jgi:hypothetical protein
MVPENGGSIAENIISWYDLLGMVNTEKPIC